MLSQILDGKIQYNFFDRTFKGSTGIYCKFKYSDQEKLQFVENNRRTIAKEFNKQKIATLKQVHSNKVIYVKDQQEVENEPEGDALITDRPGLVLGVFTADCVPILLASEDGGAIAAIHSGWRGARSDIIKNVAVEMKKISSSKMLAVVGPSIAQKSYQVDENFYNDFVDEDGMNKELFKATINKEHYLFDLPQYVQKKLELEKIQVIKAINEDTYTNPNKYPSFRRSFHKGEKYRDNILAAISIKD